MPSNLFICFRLDKEPFISTKNIVGCGCSETNSVKDSYLYHRKVYLYKQSQINTIKKINSYNSYHNIASYGSRKISKRILGPIAGDIYTFRKNIL